MQLIRCLLGVRYGDLGQQCRRVDDKFTAATPDRQIAIGVKSYRERRSRMSASVPNSNEKSHRGGIGPRPVKAAVDRHQHVGLKERNYLNGANYRGLHGNAKPMHLGFRPRLAGSLRHMKLDGPSSYC